MKVLNLYAGLGGNRKLWTDCEVTAVENNEQIAKVYKDLFPKDKLIITDAHEYLLNNYKNYDAVWGSPPCQKNSKMVKFTRHDINEYPDLRLYEEIILLDNFFKGFWVIENVQPYYEPLIKPTRQIGRHLFWSNFFISRKFKDLKVENFISDDNPEKLKKWLGIEYEGNIYYEGNHSPSQVLRNCVHPELGLHIYNEMRGIKENKPGIQLELI